MNHISKIDTQEWAASAVLLVGALIAAILVAGYAWQISKSDANLSEAVSHADNAVLLQKASVESNLAADILGLYVRGGDEVMIRRFNSQSGSALARISNAISNSDSDQVRQIAVKKASIATGADSVIALRKAGDAGAAGQALVRLGTEFETLDIAIQSAVDAELAAAVSLTTSSHNAEDTASWLLITGMSAAIAAGLGILSAARRLLFGRHPRRNPSPA